MPLRLITFVDALRMLSLPTMPIKEDFCGRIRKDVFKSEIPSKKSAGGNVVDFGYASDGRDAQHR
jgi:hypothetical protein